MEYAIGMGKGVIIGNASFIKTGPGIRKLMEVGTDAQIA
jgi:hypothetical protein